MRKLIVIASVLLGAAGVGRAQQPPLDPYGAPPQPPLMEVEGPPANPYPPPPAYPPPAPYPPQAMYPPQAGYPPPQAVYPLPARVFRHRRVRVQVTPGYYYPPSGYGAPIHSYPPPVYYVRPPIFQRHALWCASCAPAAQDKARFFSIGVHGAVLGIDQKINGQSVTLGGVGFQMRFRTRGRFGMEASVDFLHGGFDNGSQTSAVPVATADGSSSTGGSAASPTSPTFGGTSSGPYFHPGPVTRDSIPVTLSALVYIFPNQDSHIFNMYFLGGVGVMSTTMGLTDEWGTSVKQNFSEFEAHVGLGMELRFHWFALQADVRGVGLWRDDSSAPASYYSGVDGAPVPSNSWGVKGSAGAAFWF